MTLNNVATRFQGCQTDQHDPVTGNIAYMDRQHALATQGHCCIALHLCIGIHQGFQTAEQSPTVPPTRKKNVAKQEPCTAIRDHYAATWGHVYSIARWLEYHRDEPKRGDGH